MIADPKAPRISKFFLGGRGLEKGHRVSYLLFGRRYRCRGPYSFPGPWALCRTGGSRRKVIVRDFYRLRWGDGAEEIYKIFEKGIRQMPDEEDREIWTRAPEIAVRKATVLAFFRGSRTVAEVKIDGVEYLIIKESDIMQVLVEVEAKKKAA